MTRQVYSFIRLFLGWLGIVCAGGGTLLAQGIPDPVVGPAVVIPQMVELWHTGDIEWVVNGNIFRLQATVGQPATGSAEIRIPVAKGSYHAWCTITGRSEDKLDGLWDHVEAERDSKYGTTADGEANYGCTIQVSLKEGFSGDLPEVTVADIFVGEKISEFPWRNPRMDVAMFYDIDGDGVMENIESAHLGSLDGLYLCKIMGVYDVPATESIYKFDNSGIPLMEFVEGNNDGIPDILMRMWTSAKLLTGGAEGYSVQDFVQGIDDHQFLPCDYNSDGRMDFLLPDGRVYEQLWDGTFSLTTLTKMTEAQYTEMISGPENGSWMAETGGSNLISSIPGGRGLGLSGASLDPGVHAVNYSDLADNRMSDIDFNRDGRPDLLNYGTGELWTNLGNNRYVVTPMAGMLYFRDLNGDQLPDYIHYDEKQKVVTACVEDATGIVNKQQLIDNLSMDSRMWCYDFDKDGDVDILLPFSYLEGNGASYLLLFVNDGSGHFTQLEHGFAEHYFVVACADVDNDGKYEAVLASYDEVQNKTVLFKVKIDPATFESVTPEKWMEFNGCLVSRLQDSDPAEIGIDVADINGDGVYEVLTFSSDNYGHVYYQQGVTANAAPEQMEKPAYVFEASTGYLKVSWAQGNDALTSAVDLTYALRIGTASGKGDVYYAHADAAGRRRNLLDGNMGYNLDKLLNTSSWPKGKYYIAVQAIDAMHRGGAWSEEIIFDHTNLSAAFTLSGIAAATTDTVVISCARAKPAGGSYIRDLDGGEICEVNADSSVIGVRWAEPGDKTVSLQVVDADGQISQLESHGISIFANRFKHEAISYSPETTNPGLSVSAFADLDGDGVAEAFTSNGIYVNDGAAHFTKLMKTYNTTLSFVYNGGIDPNVFMLDWNNDGMVDIRYEDMVLLNTGAKNMSKQSVSNIGYLQGCFDFNNDGHVDFKTSEGILKNKGDNTFESINFSQSVSNWHNPVNIKDIDKDGLVDIGFVLQTESIGGTALKNQLVCFMNKGNFNFEKKVMPSAALDQVTVAVTVLADEDFNGDGYQDVLIGRGTVGYYDSYMILLNDRNENFDRSIELSLPLDTEFQQDKYSTGPYVYYGIMDFDNNGCPDILFSNAILYFYPDMETRLWYYNRYEGFAGIRGMDNMGWPRTVADINGDGIPDAPWVMNLSQVKNTPPEIPANLRAVQTDESVVIEWDPAVDAETPFMQMRYNVSVKKKGATGEGAFVVSPLNGLKDGAAVVSGVNYRTATRMEMPLTALATGEYEIQVQAIDAWNASSPMSASYILKVEPAALIGMPASVCVGNGATFVNKGVGTQVEWNWDGGQATAGEQNTWEVVWDEAGEKNISLTIDGVTTTAKVFVRPQPAIEFTVADVAVKDAETALQLPALAEDPAYTLEWYASKDGGNLSALCDLQGSYAWMCGDRRRDITIVRRGTTREAKVTFKEEGTYELMLVVSSDCGSYRFSHQIEVAAALPVPQIRLVTVDGASGKNKISWNLPADLPAHTSNVNIYKETSKYNDFRLLTSVALAEKEYIDMTSAPEVSSSRYRLTLAADIGAESTPGLIHRSVHVMLNRGIGNAWNLIWTPYEGAIIESYRIMRGTSPEALSVVAEVAGSAVSWSDVTPPAGDLYYALEYDTPYDDVWQPMAAERAATRAVPSSGSSNVVSVVDASNVVFAGQITIRCLESQVELTPEQTQIHLYADVYPTTTTYRNVNWVITEGGTLAEINSQGFLTSTGKGSGNVTVKAEAVDGSGITATIRIPVSVALPSITDVAVTPVSGCNGDRTGVINITATGAVQYAIQDNAWTENHVFEGLPAGEYKVQIKDASGQVIAYASNPVVISQPEAIAFTAEVTDVTVKGGSDGQISISATGGTGNLRYSVDGGVTYSNTTVYTGLSAATYVVRVQDEMGCMKENSVIVSEPGSAYLPPVIKNVEVHQISAVGANDGKITITTENGEAPLSYSINDGQTYSGVPVFSALHPGSYTIAVKDATGMVVRYSGNPVVLKEPGVSDIKMLEILDFTLQNGATLVNSRRVTLNQHVTGGVPTGYQACEDTLTVGDIWKAYENTPVYELSAGNGEKSVYMRVRGENSKSLWAKAGVIYEEAAQLTITAVLVDGGVEYVTKPGISLIILTAGGTPTEMQVRVEGESEGWVAYQEVSTYPLPLEEGEYTIGVKVRNAAAESEEMTVNVYYRKAPVKIRVEDFRINAGSTYTPSNRVTLNHWVDGIRPLYYAVTERLETNAWEWKKYEELPEFRLSEPQGLKTVYFKVSDGRDTSAVVSDEILYSGEETAPGLNVKMWPNPVTSTLYIILTETEVADNTRLEITTVMGQRVDVQTFAGREYTLNVSSYPFGILFVKLVNGNKTIVKQILKK